MKTKAPFYLFCFLGIIVCCIVISVVFAIKNPAKEDTSYLSSKKWVDQEINQMIRDYREFSKKGILYLRLDQAISSEHYRLTPPYLQDRNQTLELSLQKKNKFYLAFGGEIPDDFVALLYLERINSSEEIQSLGKIDLGIAKPIPNLQAGRYKAIFEIFYKENNLKKRMIVEKEFIIA